MGSELKDPKIKLFGKTIKLPPDTSEACGISSSLNQDPSCSSDSMVVVVQDCNNLDIDSGQQETVKTPPGPKQDDAMEENRTQTLKSSDEIKDSNATPQIVEDLKAPSADNESESATKTEEKDQSGGDSQEKTLKKPDKIIPCPRCNSMDTKFCYFNNYNVNQPRHFCKNCQRYWTAGGTMRNVPVGAGRRKNKHLVSQFRHITVPETSPNGIHHPAVSPNGTLLAFNTDSPLCESMASVLNIADKTIIRNGSQKPEEVPIPVTHGIVKENRDDESSRSPTINAKDEVAKSDPPEVVQTFHPFPPQVPCFPGAPWPYPFPPPTFSPATFPVQFYPTPPPYWGCAVPGSWNVPWIIPPSVTASQSLTPPNSGPNSPTLGKHSRDDNILKLDDKKEEEGLKESSSEKCLWVPKTLRIDDPGEAAKSSIWATLGIKHGDRGDSIGGGGLFKAFQKDKSKGDGKSRVLESSTVLQANPAALSRSVSFHESS